MTGLVPTGFLPTPSNIELSGTAFEGFNKTFLASLNTGGGLTGYYWDGSGNGWIPNQPLTINNDPKGASQSFTSIAQNYQQRLYAITNDTIQEYRWDTSNPLTLIYVGEVALVKPGS